MNDYYDPDPEEGEAKGFLGLTLAFVLAVAILIVVDLLHLIRPWKWALWKRRTI